MDFHPKNSQSSGQGEIKEVKPKEQDPPNPF